MNKNSIINQIKKLKGVKKFKDEIQRNNQNEQ